MIVAFRRFAGWGWRYGRSRKRQKGREPTPHRTLLAPDYLLRNNDLRRTMNTIAFIRIDGSATFCDHDETITACGLVPGERRATMGLP
ncbi:hypothetical protein Abr02nite_24650 [Paractinoplanes brasiliensis]|nr:hypothetical protein Abr02nite_24650 [Actinoplanes brasiliensis]